MAVGLGASQYRLVSLLDTPRDLLGGEPVERVAGDEGVSFSGHLSVEARGAAGAVEDRSSQTQASYRRRQEEPRDL
jgi:hypothetical protein